MLNGVLGWRPPGGDSGAPTAKHVAMQVVLMGVVVADVGQSFEQRGSSIWLNDQYDENKFD